MTKHIKPAPISDNDAPITLAELQQILLSADLISPPEASEDDLIAEAARLRAEIRVAKEVKARLGDIWDKNRNKETSDNFQEAIETHYALEANLKELLGDLRRTQSPQPPKSKRRKYTYSGPQQ